MTIALFDPGAFERFQAAKEEKNLSKAELEKTREDILALVATLFADAQRKQQTVNLLQTIVDKDQMAYELSEDHFVQGTGTELNSNNYKSDLQQTKYLLAQAKLQAQEASLDLAAALQLPINVPIVFVEDKDFIKTLENNAVVNFDNVTNADMELASSTLEARKADKKAVKADLLPKVTGSADYGRSGGSPDHGSNTYSVGVQATVPIWEGGNTQAKLKEVNGQIKEAEANLIDVSQQTEVNVAKARAAIAESEDLKESKSQKRLTDQKALHIAFHSQEIGTGSAFEVMQAKADLAMAEDEYNEAQATWVMAHIDLFHAQGRLRQLVKKEEL